MIKAIVFDFDDTLVRTYDHCKWMVGEISERLGLRRPDVRMVSRHWGRSIRDFSARLWPGARFDEFTAAASELEGDPPAVSGAHEIIDILGRQYVIGIVTGSERPTFLRRALRARIDLKRFSFIITASENPLPKSDPRYLESAFRELGAFGVSREEAVFVGDSIHDAELSRKAGTHFVGVLTGPTRREDLLSDGVEERMIIPSVVDLPQVIRQNGFS